MSSVIEKIGNMGIIPIAKIIDVKKVDSLANALIEGNLPAVEITLRSETSAQIITALKTKYPDIIVGAGTVLALETAEAAVAAGADYIMTPGLNLRIIDYCINADVPVIPGVSSVAQIGQAVAKGLNVIGFAPAEDAGGLATLRVIAESFKDVLFVPSGGITEENLKDYLLFESVHACCGDWMFNPDLLEVSDFEKMTQLIQKASFASLGFRLKDVTFFENDTNAMERSMNLIDKIFNFSGEQSEVSPSLLKVEGKAGKKSEGIISIETLRPKIAYSYLCRNGVTVKKMSEIYVGNELTEFELDVTMASFDVKIVRKEH